VVLVFLGRRPGRDSNPVRQDGNLACNLPDHHLSVKDYQLRETGWSSGKKLKFYLSNQGLTPAQVNNKNNKKDRKPLSVPLMTAESQGVLKMIKNLEHLSQITLTAC